MEDSIVKNKPEMIHKRGLYLTICKSLLQIPTAISRFLRFQLCGQHPQDSSSATTVAADGKISFVSGLVPAPMAASLAATQTSRGITSASRGLKLARKPPWSSGGGGKINFFPINRNPPRLF